MSARPEQRVAVTSVIEGDHTDPEFRQHLKLLDPHPRGDGHAMREEDRWTLTAGDGVDRAAVVAGEATRLVEGELTERPGVRVGSSVYGSDHGPFGDVRGRRRPPGDTAHAAERGEPTARRAHPTSRRGTRGPMPVTIS